jgi:DNA-binding transcriptional ArsR family regulator
MEWRTRFTLRCEPPSPWRGGISILTQYLPPEYCPPEFSNLILLDGSCAASYLTGRLHNAAVQLHMSPDQLSHTFAALADPTRRAILARLASGEASVTELARPFDMSLPAISKHLKVLERAGLIAQGREAQWRPRVLRAEPLREAAEWLEEYRRFWEQSLDRLEQYLGELQGKEVPDEHDPK